MARRHYSDSYLTRRHALWVFAMIALSCAAPAPPPARPMITGLDVPAASGAMAPHLAAAGTGAIMTWLEPDGGGHRVRFSRLTQGNVWSAPSTIASGADFFVNWADFPAAETTPSGSLVAHWLQKSGAGTYAYDVQLARSEDGGATWSRLGPAHDDGTRTEHGFVSFVAESDAVRAFWLDGRAMAAEGSESAGHEGHGAMTLRTALVGKEVGAGEVLDAMTCECCQTDAAMTASGPIVVYRDRTPEEIRDIAIVRRDGDGWTPPAPVHADGWVVPGCPVNGPAVAAGGPDGKRVAVAWFTASENRPRVQAAFSTDAGATFDPPLVIDAAAPLGRVDIALDDEDGAILAWLGSVDQDDAAVRMIRVPGPWAVERPPSARPSASTPLTLTLTGGTRASGFPRIVRRGSDVVVAWTGMSQDAKVRTAVVPVAGIPRFAPGPALDAGDRRQEKPEYAARDLGGGRLALSDLRGGPVLLNFWATWCLPCREEIPVLEGIHQRYAPRGLRVAAVSLDEAGSVEAVRSLVKDHKVPYTNLHDPDGLGWSVFGLTMLPATLLIDETGQVVWKRQGVIHRDDPELERALKALIDRSG